jgi:6-phosphofructokinase 1
MQRSIAILCSGGDVSGMNPALKYFVEYTLKRKDLPYFIHNGFDGLIDGDIKKAHYKDVAGIITKGGSIIGSARSSRFREKKYREKAYKELQKYNITQLVILGGDGSFRGINQFYKEFNISFSAIPSTIDNDIYATEYALGVDTSLNIIKNAIDSIRDTASTFSRAFIIETMGRECGYLALVSHLTSGSELCLIPEIDYDLSLYKKQFLQELQNGRNYFIAIVAEGIKEESSSIAQWFEKEIGIQSRVTVLGHIQRGGNPSVYDRLMAHKFVHYALDALYNEQKNSVVCYTKEGFLYKSIKEVVENKKELDKDLLKLL